MKNKPVRVGYKVTDEQIKFVVEARNNGDTFGEIATAFNSKFDSELDRHKTEQAIRAMYERWCDQDLSDDSIYKNIKARQSSRERASFLSKENKVLTQASVAQDRFLDAVAEAVSKVKKIKLQKLKPIKAVKGKAMIMETLFSDIHYGKKTKTFNLEVCRARMREYVRTIKQEYITNSASFKVQEIILAFIGDIIESSTMHGPESLIGCEFGNSEQVQVAIESIFEDVLVPLSQLGVNLTFIGVAGNHDRTEESRTFNLVGRANVTWTIYKTLEFLCKKTGLNSITFHIPDNAYFIYDIFGSKVLYEHGDNCKGNAYKSLEGHMLRRAQQADVVIDFFRYGHFHEYIVYGRGKIIGNGSLPGQDSYAETLGFDSEAIQVINTYCETENRPTPFYKSFPVYLEKSSI